MRVIFDHPLPFSLCHGGFQIQLEQTLNALREAKVDVEHLRWWDDRQTADIIHYFGRPPVPYVEHAQKKGIRIVMTQLLTGLGSRSRALLQLQKIVITLARNTLPEITTARFAWDVFQKVDAATASTAWESYLMNYVFGAPKEKVYVIANGVEEVFRQSPVVPRGQWLVCTATVTERKRVLELARAAVMANTPLWIIGKPYGDADPYAQQFLAVARQNPQIIRYEGAISDRAQLARIYRESRGFVLLSTMETLSLSADEAAACECPLLLSDLPWARTTFENGASYCPIVSPSRTAEYLRRFYDSTPQQMSPRKPPTWATIGTQLKAVYENVLTSG
jgi:glycosyltransferase involved in cell wall biosynthesis